MDGDEGKYEVEDLASGPFTIRSRQLLLDAMRESRVEGEGAAPAQRPDCTGMYCRSCKRQFWLDLRADMTPEQRKAIDVVYDETGFGQHEI